MVQSSTEQSLIETLVVADEYAIRPPARSLPVTVEFGIDEDTGVLQVSF